MADDFLTVAEIAELLKLNQMTVRNWIDQGKLPAMRVGRRVRVRRADFDRLIDESYISAGSQASAASGPSIREGEVPRLWCPWIAPERAPTQGRT
jgi:excisionase family DNA binding protein